MMLILERRYAKDNATIGALFVGGEYQCDTLEDAVREVPGEPVRKWKIPGNTAIPSGKYFIEIVNSPRFGPDTLSLIDVPGFSAIRIHAGNSIADTDGCILVGKAAGGVILGGTSKPALKALKALIMAAILTRGEQVWIEIKNSR